MQTLPKVLLLGDSIRISYQPHVARFLEGKAEVCGPSDNCQFSQYTLSSLDRWINELGHPTIIHWNNGIHDSGHNPKRTPVQIPIDEYLANIEAILAKLTALTPNVIWATTTPVHPDRPYSATDWTWYNEEMDRYNAVARELMVREGIPINDLHAIVWKNLSQFLVADRLHLNTEGQEACAKEVANSVSRFLPQ